MTELFLPSYFEWVAFMKIKATWHHYFRANKLRLHTLYTKINSASKAQFNWNLLFRKLKYTQVQKVYRSFATQIL